MIEDSFLKLFNYSFSLHQSMPLELPGLSAWLQCAGSQLECYEVEYSNDRKAATCWVASEIGKVRALKIEFICVCFKH